MEQVENNRKQYVIMLVFGLCMLAVSTWVAHEYRDYRHDIQSTTGTVTKIITEEIGDGAERKRAVVEFTAESGKSHTFRIPVAGTFFDYSPGESVTVVYDPGIPTNASVDGFWATWSLIMLCFGVTYLAFVLVFRGIHYIRYRNVE